jgi:5-methylcytosine-specific restriction enzyme subunit McrC
VRRAKAVQVASADDRIVRVLERQRVPLPRQLDTSRIRERLVAAAEAAGMRDALENRRRGLFAKGAVGVVDIGEIAVEILPKTHEGSKPDEERAFLVDLLRFVGRDRGPFATAAASIREGGGGLVEVLYAWAVVTAARYAETGLPRRYVPLTETSTAVRGRIDMKRVALARPGRDFELIIQHAPLTIDNDLSRAVRWLVREVALRTRRSETRRMALAIIGGMRTVAEVEPEAALFEGALLRPLEQHWAPLLAFGRSLVRQRRLDPASAGGQPSVAVLFTLHDLFERALRRVLQDEGPAAGLHPGHIPRFLLRSNMGDGSVQLKPDYVLRLTSAAGDCLAVGDAKWKDIWTASGMPEPSREDAYQLASYITAGDAQVGFLFAPLIGVSDGKPLRVFRHTMSGAGAKVDIVGVHMPTLLRRDLTGEHLRRRLCEEVASAMRSVGNGEPGPSRPKAA